MPIIHLGLWLIRYFEAQAEGLANKPTGTFRGLFYRRNGPINAGIQTLKQVIGPNFGWGKISTQYLETEEDPF